MRTCPRCSISKPLDAFRRDSSGKDGYRRECKACEYTRKNEARRKKVHVGHMQPGMGPGMTEERTGHPLGEFKLQPADQVATSQEEVNSRPVQWASTSRASDARRWVWLFDVHVPFEDKPKVRAVCDFMRDWRPHGLGIGGDFLDMIEVSRHAAGSVATLEGKRIAETFAAGNRVLDQLEAAAGPQCTERRFLAGNHCDRMSRWLKAGDNAVFTGDPLVDIAGRLNLKQRGYQVNMKYPGGYFKVGKLHVIHGNWCNKHHAATTLERFQASVLYGHSHISQMFHGSTFDGQRGAYGSGHLADVDSEAMNYRPIPSAWTSGFAIVFERPSGDFQVQLLNFVNGAFHYGDRMYGVI